jgi:hypothetical protein
MPAAVADEQGIDSHFFFFLRAPLTWYVIALSALPLCLHQEAVHLLVASKLRMQAGDWVDLDQHDGTNDDSDDDDDVVEVEAVVSTRASLDRQ